MGGLPWSKLCADAGPRAQAPRPQRRPLRVRASSSPVAGASAASAPLPTPCRERPRQGDQEAGRGGASPKRARRFPRRGANRRPGRPGPCTRPMNRCVARWRVGQRPRGAPGRVPRALGVREADRELFPRPGPRSGIPWTNDGSSPRSPSPNQVTRLRVATLAVLCLSRRAALGARSWLAPRRSPCPSSRSAGMRASFATSSTTATIRAAETWSQAWIKKSGRYGGDDAPRAARAGAPRRSPLGLARRERIRSRRSARPRAPRASGSSCPRARASTAWSSIAGSTSGSIPSDRPSPRLATSPICTAASAAGSSRSRPTTWATAGCSPPFASTTPTTTGSSRARVGHPFETALYVPKIIAMAVVAKNFATFGIDALKVDAPLAYDPVGVPSA